MVKKLIAAAGVVVVLLVGVGVWFFVIRDDTVEKASAECDPAPCEASTLDSVDGTWAVDPDASEGTIVITETIGSIADHDAEGKTGPVTGDLTVADGQVTAADLTIDLTGLEFVDQPTGFDVGNRTNAMRTQGLEIDAFPEATFSLTAPIDLGDDPTAGTTASATGDLTIHGVTNAVTFEVAVEADGDTFRITPTEFIPVPLADYDMTVSAPGFVADIADEGSIDFLLVISQA